MRKAAVVASIAAASLILAACSGSSESEPTQQASASASDITWANDAAWHKAGQDALGAASKPALGFGISSEIFPTTDAYQAQVRSSITTKDAFPLFDWWFGYRMQDLAEQDLLVDVTDVWDEAIAQGEYPASLKDLFSWKGKAYGLPKLVNYWGVFYSKPVFEKYNLSVPKTWDDLLAMCKTLKENKVYCFGQQISDRSWASFIWFEEVLLRTDPKLYMGVLDGSIAYDDPRVVEAVGAWTDMIQAGYITPTALLNTDNSVQEFAKGTYAMQLIGDWTSTSLNEAGLSGDKDYGFFVMPGITPEGNRGLIAEARVTLLSKASSGVEQAKEFAKYFMGVDGATVWAKTAEINSPNLKVAADTRPEFLVALSDQVSAGDYEIYPRYWEGTPTPVVDAVYPLLGKIAENPADAAAILAEAQAAAKAAWPAN
jgi:ABC-type glycerol-3-phosphate transport system substrate-binding protein